MYDYQACLVLSQTTRPHAWQLASQAVDYLKQYFQVVHLHDIREIQHISQHYTVALTFGGDGTALSAGRLLAGTETPIIAVNMGRVGFIAHFDSTNWQQGVIQFLSNQLTLLSRSLLQVSVHRDQSIIYHDHALNEILLQSHDSLLSSFDMQINAFTAGSIRADGMIVATNTGSTGYALSCGGSIISPYLSAMILIAKNPFSLGFRPLILSYTDIVKLNFVHDTSYPLLILDGQKRYALQPNDSVFVEYSSRQVLFVQKKNYNFYDALREKLLWGSGQWN
jgi:NAD+ kinase